MYLIDLICVGHGQVKRVTFPRVIFRISPQKLPRSGQNRLEWLCGKQAPCRILLTHTFCIINDKNQQQMVKGWCGLILLHFVGTSSLRFPAKLIRHIQYLHPCITGITIKCFESWYPYKMRNQRISKFSITKICHMHVIKKL